MTGKRPASKQQTRHITILNPSASSRPADLRSYARSRSPRLSRTPTSIIQKTTTEMAISAAFSTFALSIGGFQGSWLRLSRSGMRFDSRGCRGGSR